MAGQVVKQTIDIRAPAKAIFDLLMDPAHVKIDGSTAGGGGSAMVRRLRRGPARLSMGSTFTVFMRLFGVPYRATNRVVEFEPNRLIAWRHFEPQHWRYDLQPVAGDTRVRSRRLLLLARVGRWFIRLLGWPGRNQRAITRTQLRLKADAEHRTWEASR